MKRIGIIDQTFRDGPQSLWASRITTGMMLPIAEQMDQIGFDYMDVGAAGAIADVAVRHLKENPWERTRLLRERIRNTPMAFAVRARNDIAFKIVPQDIQFLWIERRIRWSDLPRIILAAMKISAIVMAIIAVSGGFGVLVAQEQLATKMATFLGDNIQQKWVMLLLILRIVRLMPTVCIQSYPSILRTN